MCNIRLHNQDCVEAMRKMSDKSFDLAIVDPPFGIGKTWKKNRRGQKGFSEEYTNGSIPDRSYFKELFRVSVNWIVWGANFFPFLWPSKNVIVWDKGCLWETDHKSECEIAVTNIQCRPVSIYRHMWGGARKGSETGVKIIHPHQKPVALYKWILAHYARAGFRILDTHLGSASIAIACFDMGFDLDGYEIIEQYHSRAVERLEHHKKQLLLFSR